MSASRQAMNSLPLLLTMLVMHTIYGSKHLMKYDVHMDISPDDIRVESNASYKLDVTFFANEKGQHYLRAILEEDPFVKDSLQSCPYQHPFIELHIRQPESDQPPPSYLGCYIYGTLVLTVLLVLFVTGLVTIIMGKN
jgi:hypothetical protein